jgi:hypothetical protein
VIGETERASIEALCQVSRAIAEDYVALAESQVGEQALYVHDPLERSEHHNDVAL